MICLSAITNRLLLSHRLADHLKATIPFFTVLIKTLTLQKVTNSLPLNLKRKQREITKKNYNSIKIINS